MAGSSGASGGVADGIADQSSRHTTDHFSRTSGRRPGEPSSWRDELGCLVAAVVGLILVALTVLGLVTAIRWVL
ncbi:hypothetical protein AB0J89_18280 [Micromonospora chokoriensis]